MPIPTSTRRAALGMILAASAAGTIVQAQDAGRPVPPPPGGQGGELVINCCRCLGQESGASNISTGTAPWRVSSVLAPPNVPTNSSALTVPGAIANPHPSWTTALTPAKWLQPSASATRNDGFLNGHVTYVLKLRVPNCTIKQRVVLSGRIAADDVARMFVEGPGHPPSTMIAGPAGFPVGSDKPFSVQLGVSGFTQPGLYTLRVEVDNLGGGPFAMILNGTANGKCDGKLEKGKDDRAEDCKDC
jgi:hypothetical protein